jgi:DNA ligase 1
MSTKPLAQQVVPGANGAESATAEDGAVRPRDSLFHWCGTVDAIRQSADRYQKGSLLRAYFESVAEATIAPAARFFCGLIFPRHDTRATHVSWSLLVDTIQNLTRIRADEFRARYESQGDLGDVAAEAFAGRLPSGIAVIDIEAWADEIAATTEMDRQRSLLHELLARLNSLEARYLVKLIGGEFRIGLEEADIEEALARTFGQPLESVRRANAEHRDIGAAALLARRGYSPP